MGATPRCTSSDLEVLGGPPGEGVPPTSLLPAQQSHLLSVTLTASHDPKVLFNENIDP